MRIFSILPCSFVNGDGAEHEDICNTELAKRADVLVVVPYVEALRCEGRLYGSSNQKIHRKTEENIND